MKGIKIDIKKTWVEIPHGIYREAVRDQMHAAMMETGKVPENIDMSIREVTYFPHKVYQPGDHEVHQMHFGQ